MNYKHLTFLLLTSPLLLHAATSTSQTKSQSCESTHDLNRVSIRHIESKGLGYNNGYTTLEGFFVPLSALNTRWVPFLDLRGHIFNNSKPAANAGVGLRYIESRVWGGNVYYDYRKTHERNYNQVSFGFESLGRYLDYRINGYFPVGKHKGSLSDATFDHFSGNSLYLSRKQELALKGTNAEVGVHIAKVKGIDFYSALGPYYFANDTKHTFGGEFRIGMDVLNILRIEGNTSYDHLFKWIGQGQISLSYAFTPKKMSRKERKGSCSFHGYVRDRAFQRVDKQEIIVVTTQKKKSVAINPATGLPYVFWFVDNTSHSAGTYESPFNTLLDAQSHSGANDIIAVLPGDGTDRGMNTGIALKNGQKLWGMSVLHALSTSLGTIKIKPLVSEMPSLSNSMGGVNVIDSANSNDIVGLKIFDTQGTTGIYVSGTGNYNMENNIISTSQGGFGVEMNSVLGSAVIDNNTFIGSDMSITEGIAFQGVSSGSFTMSNNLFTGINTNSGFRNGIDIPYGNLPLHFLIINNQMNFHVASMNAVAGIAMRSRDFSVNSTCVIAGNKINNIYFSGNTGTVTAGIGVQLQGSMSVTLINNTVSTSDQIKMPAYSFENKGGASLLQVNFSPDNIGKPTNIGF